MNLGLSEATLLKQALDDPDIGSALEKFVEKHKVYYSNRCADLVKQGKQEEAKQSAWFSTAYESVLPELRQYVENQLELL
jgi:uncharacterized HAD superfamily protein